VCVFVAVLPAGEPTDALASIAAVALPCSPSSIAGQEFAAAFDGRKRRREFRLYQKDLGHDPTIRSSRAASARCRASASRFHRPTADIPTTIEHLGDAQPT